MMHMKLMMWVIEKNNSFYPENGYGLMDANLITHLSKNIFSFYLL